MQETNTIIKEYKTHRIISVRVPDNSSQQNVLHCSIQLS